MKNAANPLCASIMSNNTPTPTSDKTKTSGSTGESDFSLQVGASILDRFVVKSLLGKGGMGSVFHVRHEHLNTDYALKVLSQKGQESLWKRFENEARAASKLDHPNLIRVYESGLLPDGNPYFIMELVHGESLSDLLKRTGRLPISKALKIFIQVGFALSYAHEIGVIHRDLKPSNIMLTKSEGTSVGTIKVVDLGIAKLTGRDEFNQQTLTKTGEILGSPLYMSPEQCLGVIVDKRSDLYSFGCALFETLTGAPPLIGDCALSTMMKHQSERPVSLREASLGISFPKSLETLIARLLEKDPDARYSSAHIVTAELVRIEQELLDIEISRNEESAMIATATKAFSKSNTSEFRDLWKQAFPILTFGLGIACATIYQNFVQPPQTNLNTNTMNGVSSRSPAFSIFPNSSGKDVSKPNSFKPPDSVTYFSTIDKAHNLRIFDFGHERKKFYGVIWQPTKQALAAVGTIKYPYDADVFFQPDPRMIENPESFAKFRSDDFTGFEVNDEVTKNFEVVKMLPRFNKLKALRIEMNIDDSYLKYIDALPNLTSLNLSNSRVTGGGIMKLKRIKQFESLGCSYLEGKEQITSQLKDLKLQSLSMDGLELSAEDLKRIAQLKSLKFLSIAGNGTINDHALAQLANHPSLEVLDIRGTLVSVRCLPTLASLRNLKLVRLSKEQLLQKDFAILQSGLRHKGPNNTTPLVELAEGKIVQMQ